MIDFVKYRVALRRLVRQKEKICFAYAKQISEAHKERKKLDDIRALESSAWFEEQMLNEEISILATTYWISKATKHFITIPSRAEEGMWEQCDKISERFVLTSSGISVLRSSLRTERKERRDLILPYILAFTGIIGALTGLIAILRK